MRRDALKKLRCPACFGELETRSFAEGSDDAVETGALVCERCRVAYPIEAGVPVLLRFSTAFHEWFSGEYASRLAELGDYSLPHDTPREGEIGVQETFTDEWNLLHEDELSFGYTHDELVALNRRVWLRWLDQLPAAERPSEILEVGCGGGAETLALQELTGAEDIFAIDLNFSLLSRSEELRDLPGVTFVVASLFDLPFAQESFDLVYCEGVLHHTYSTAEAFAAIAPKVRLGGHQFIWVYGLEDNHIRGVSRFKQRRHQFIEAVVRPVVSRLPGPVRDAFFKSVTSVWHLRQRQLARHKDKWQRASTEHHLRDWLSPRYAHRHGYNEVIEWFEASGMEVVDTQSPSVYKEMFGATLPGIGMSGRRPLKAGGEGSAGSRTETASAA